jgi:fimbrial chaperone protein
LNSFASFRQFLFAACALAITQSANADGFAAAASPSRFEIEAKAGEVISKMLDIQHVGPKASEYMVRTADWTLSEERGLEFYDTLQPGSCRPWVKLERKLVKVDAKSRKSFRFEVHIPADADPMECRFAIMVEGADQKVVPLMKDIGLQLPLSGRLGVIVYVAIGGAAPKLEVLEISRTSGADALPFVHVKNTGNAHGRLDGALKATDAAGKSFFLPVSTIPVMPGQSRMLTLTPAENLQTKKTVSVVYPVKVTGKLEWDQGAFQIDADLK